MAEIVIKDPFIDELVTALIMEWENHLPEEAEKHEMMRLSHEVAEHWFAATGALNKALAKKKIKLIVTPWVIKKLKKLPTHINTLIPIDSRKAVLAFVRDLTVEIVSDSISKSIAELAEKNT